MTLWWEEKELGQMLANPDERYHAMMAISTDLCKTERAMSKTQTIAHHCPPCKRGGLICARENGRSLQDRESNVKNPDERFK